MNRHDATTGTVQGDVEHRRIQSEPEYRRFIALMTKDKLVSLGEALGIMACENPEQGAQGTNLHANAGDLVRAISKRLGVDMTPPDIDGGLLKIEAGGSLLNERDLNAIYTARTLSGLSPGSVCEIGAGSGRVAYWSYRMGVRPYTLVDLPHINVIQGFYLLKALPDARIRLHGEEEGGDLRILPCDAVESVGRVDLVLNQDSFPEIERAIVVNYLAWVKRNASRFLSVNHESKPAYGSGRQLSVPEVVEEAGGFLLESRALYWLRKGYVMERYSVQPTG